MKCAICKHGELVAGTTTVTLERENATIVITHVPAKVCIEPYLRKDAQVRPWQRLSQRADHVLGV